MGPARTVGPTEWRRNSNEVTTPKLPPPPRNAQNRSGCSSSGARHVVASAPYGNLQIVVAGETHGRDHVGGPNASGDQVRAPVNGTVPDCTGDVIVGVVGID